MQQEIQQLCAINKPQIPEEYQEFKDIFMSSLIRELPEHSPFDHEIKLMDGKELIFKPIYQLSELESRTLREYLDENLKKGYICQSKSPARYPIIFVKKKDGSLWLCMDYQHLNLITIKDRHPLLLIQEI